MVGKYQEQYRNSTKHATVVDYLFLGKAIDEHSGVPENMTNYLQGLLMHLKEYFKENQKKMVMLYRPFELEGRLELVPVFWPFLVGDHTLHSGFGYYNLKNTTE